MKAIITIIFLIATLQVSAQSIRGTITDEQRNPVQFANIAALSSKDSTLIGGTVSDDKGTFGIDNVNEGSM